MSRKLVRSEQNWRRSRYDKNKLHKSLNKIYIIKKCGGKWIELERIIFSEIIWSQIDEQHIFLLFVNVSFEFLDYIFYLIEYDDI